MMQNITKSRTPISVINIGADIFADALEAQNVAVTRVAWRPQAGDGRALQKLLADPAVDAANKLAVERMLAAHPVLVDVRPAHEAIPALRDKKLLHAGPSIAWERMCGPMRGAVIGACMYEGWASNEAEAVALAEAGALDFEPCHHYNAVGPMAGIILTSIPGIFFENSVHGKVTFGTLNKGLRQVRRFWALSPQHFGR